MSEYLDAPAEPTARAAKRRHDKTRMKNSGVLTRRAVLFTATVMAVTVAVSLCAGLAGSWVQLNWAARHRLRPQVDVLAEQLQQSGTADAGMAAMLEADGGFAWLWDGEGAPRPLGAHAAAVSLPEKIAERLGERYAQGSARVGGVHCFYVVRALPAGALVAAAPVTGLPVGILCALLTALIGAGVGLATGRLLIERMLRPAVDPVFALRDAAVAMADGHLETRADERVEGELGELGKALNHLSDQLSRNLYTLIVERNRLRNMLNGLSEGIVAIDAGGRVTQTNPALGRLVPRGTKRHYADPRMKTIPDATIWADFDRVMATGETLTRNLETNDTVLRMTVTPIVDEINATAGAVGLFSDVTQMERLERTRREYVSNVNHELRTPLTAMRALIEPLKEGMVTEEADRQRYYDIILREIMRLSRLINDQLELSRLQSGTLSIEKSRITIDDLVYDVCDRYNVIAREHGLKLRVNTDFSQCPPVYANPDRLEQVLIILLDNAIKYTEKGSVSLSARWDDEKVVVSVVDTGIGIDASDLPYVFDRFYKVDKAHSGKGSGLGLSIAKEVLNRMDEDIRVTSEKGKGTQFSFTIHRNGPEGKQG